MILRRSRELVINLGDYESARIGAEVTLDPQNDQDAETIKNNSPVHDITEAADNMLTTALAAEVHYFHEITTKKGSFIHLVEEDNGKKNG